ncbi:MULTISPECIES: CRISPR-associated endonuclease Cas4/Cas1 [Corynebacterium]|uniref:CRISPR-associated endonuclease Cas1 n=1 Tax=Corynebacterium ramonii TaxID=3026968 RepID=A0ABM5RP77_9CORY|nr:MULTISPECIES: CRISPR-associated endonuclease Cas4/Cas1 [Corynebacterium]AIU31710.1 CRISPR-associated protein [Corynebacterium ramonii FRC0011]ESU59234.1 CRISPR-associated protein Cas1 [Corynebacterium ulcerans NCTC 12077]STC79997.1 putative CRISPR-associated protein [Corynebacterium ulcerans]
MQALIDPVPISLVVHTEYCERRTWLELNGEQTDTYQMQAGKSSHVHVDNLKTSTPHRQVSVKVWSDELGILGICDSLESLPDGTIRVVEFKATPVRKAPIVTDANRLQLALQGICLREMGYKKLEYAVYFTDHRKTIEVELSSADFEHAKTQALRTHEIAQASTSPVPLDEDPQCTWCSHLSVCLPDELLQRQPQRRVLAQNPDSQVLHLTEQGSRASKKNGRIEVHRKSELLGSVPIERVQAVVLHGNIDLSSALIRELAWQHRPVVWCSSTGRLYGWMLPGDGPNGLARVRQHVLAETGFIPIASEIISSKIYNQATMLRRHGSAKEAVASLRRLQETARTVNDIPSLFGVEGEAASKYFESFGSMLNDAALHSLGAQWLGRKGRGAQDHINVLLNYAYGMLTAECVRALIACGLDPHAGFLHSSNRNKPAAALDLMEEFRPVVADSVVLTLINRREISSRDFFIRDKGQALTTDGRKKIVKAFERRIQTQFKHPTFGYSVSWRRAIEVQARMMLGVLDGTQLRYKGVKIR